MPAAELRSQLNTRVSYMYAMVSRPSPQLNSGPEFVRVRSVPRIAVLMDESREF